MEYGNIDEDTIIQRLLYKEKPDLNSLAHKCVELEKVDYAKIKVSQRDEIILGLLEDLNSLEQFTEKQSVLHDMYVKEVNFHQDKQAELGSLTNTYLHEIQFLKQSLEQEKSKRQNLLEFEKHAKDVNSLPTREQSLAEIAKIELEIDQVRRIRTEKEMKIYGLQMSGSEVLKKLKEMLKTTEDLISQ